MTTADPAPGPVYASLAVPARRGPLDTTFAAMAVTQSLIAVMMLVLAGLSWMTGTGWLAVVLAALAAVAAVFVVAYLVPTWRSNRAIAVPLEIGPAGITMRSCNGEVTAGWDTVSEVALAPAAFGQQVLRVRCAPEVFEPLEGRYARSTARKHGLRYGLRVLATTPAALDGAVWHFSGGRFRLS
jgi:hypothetical protein